MVTAREVPPTSTARDDPSSRKSRLRRRQRVLLAVGAIAAVVAAVILWFVPAERLATYTWATWEPVPAGTPAPVVTIDTEARRLSSNLPAGLSDRGFGGDFGGLDWIVSGYAGTNPGTLAIAGPDAMLPISVPLASGDYFLVETGDQRGWLRTTGSGVYEVRYEPDGDASGMVLAVTAQRLERGRLWNGPGPGFPIGLGLLVAAGLAAAVVLLGETVAMGRIGGAMLAAAAAAVPVALIPDIFWFGKPGLPVLAIGVLLALAAGVGAATVRTTGGRGAPAWFGIAALAVPVLLLSVFLIAGADAALSDSDDKSLHLYAIVFAAAAGLTAMLAAAVSGVKRPAVSHLPEGTSE